MIHNKDCIQGLQEMKDNSVELVFADPPYNVDFKYSDYEDDKTRQEYQEWCEKWFKELKRVCNGIILITPGTNNWKMWYDIQGPRGTIIWYKPNSVTPSRMCGINVFEPILVYVCSETMKHKVKVDILKENISIQKEIGNHPCPKPLKLLRSLISSYSNENDTVLDPFIGSGTTAVAAKQLGRKFVGFEISAEYCEIARKRLEQNNLLSFVNEQECLK